MKKHLRSVFMSLLMMIFVTTVYSQTVPLKPLYEEFTSSTCGPCAGANAILDPILQANPGTHSLIKYQMDWPGSGDPYYTEEGGVRKVYYGVSAVPAMFINAESLYPGDMTQGIYDSYLTETTSMEINILNAEIDEDYMATIEVEINPLIDYPAGLTAQIVIVEKTTVGNVMGNGETEFFNVMMKMLPDAYGTTLGELSAGNAVTLNESCDMSLTFMEQPTDLAVIVFVQNDTNKELLQSEQTDVFGEFDAYNITFNVEDSDGGLVQNAEIFLEGNGTKYTDFGGQATYEGVFPGDYWNTVEKPGLFSAEGDLTVVDADITIDVVLEVPDFYFFEDFGENIPADWTIYSTNPDFLYWSGGKVIFFRQSGTTNDILLVSPQIDISMGETLFFDIGEQYGSPTVSFGTMSNPNDPATYEILDTYTPGSEMTQQSFDLTSYEGDDMYLAWRLEGTAFSFFSFDNVIITELIMFAPPVNLEFQYDGVGDIELSWGEPSTPGFTGYNVFHSLDGGDYVLISENQEEATYVYVEPEIASHSFYVTALYDEIESEPSNTVDVVVTSINENSDASYRIYPNPVSDVLFIESEAELHEVILFDSKGQAVHESDVKTTSYQVNMKSFGSGIYLLKVKTKVDTYTNTIVVR